MKARSVSRRAKTGSLKTNSLLLLAFGVAGAALIHRTTHGVWFPRRGPTGWPAHAATASRWEPWNPIPLGFSIDGIWGERTDDVWAWSSIGVMHWDGRAWARVLRPPRGDGFIAGVMAPSGRPWVRFTSDQESPGDGCIPGSSSATTNDWCWVGDAWKQEGCGATPSFACESRVETSGPVSHRIGAELWTVHNGRGLRHFDGARWTEATNLAVGGLGAIWLADDDDGWAISGGRLLRWDGDDWKSTDVTSQYLQSLWGAAADDVWVVGGDGLVMHFDGKAWSKQWLFHHPALTAVAGRGRDDVWIAGCDGAGFTAHWDGARWTQHNIAPVIEHSDPAFDICPLIAAESGGSALVAVRDRLFERSLAAGGWQEATSPLAHADGAPLAGGQITALAARGDRPSGMWAVGTHSNDELWTRSPFVMRRAGDAWTREALPEAIGGARAIWAPDPDDVWVVGARGLILHFDGHAWTRDDSGTDEELVAIHGAGDSIWVLGAEGSLLRRRR